MISLITNSKLVTRSDTLNNKVIAIAVIAVIVVGVAAVAIAGLNGGSKENTVEVYQSDGTYKKVPHNPERVVCLSTYTCEVLMFLNVSDKVVGTCTTTFNNIDLKEAYKDTTDVGAFNKPTMTKVLETKPDLVIAYPGYPDVEDKLEELGLNYVFLKCADAETITKEVESLGKIFDKQDRAEKYINFANQIFDKIDKLVQDNVKTKKTVYMTSFATFLKASSSTSAYYKLAQRAGADMIYDVGDTAITIQASDLLTKDPQFIIETPMLSGMVDGKAKTTYDTVMNDTTYSSLQALEDEHLYLICSQLFGGPRCFSGLVACYNILNSDVAPSNLTWDGVLQAYNLEMGLNTSIGPLFYPTGA